MSEMRLANARFILTTHIKKRLHICNINSKQRIEYIIEGNT